MTKKDMAASVGCLMYQRRGTVFERGGAAPSAGSTLFERMANLSRGGAKPDEDEDDDDDAGSASLSIPRFLNRQNNQ